MVVLKVSCMMRYRDAKAFGGRKQLPTRTKRVLLHRCPGEAWLLALNVRVILT
jgi:hypothetical protein